MKNKPGNFKKGCTPGPGRPKGSSSGRTKALLVLDEIMGREENLERLRIELQDAFGRKPLGFWLKFVVPLLPKESRVEFTRSLDLGDLSDEELQQVAETGRTTGEE